MCRAIVKIPYIFFLIKKIELATLEWQNDFIEFIFGIF